MKSIKYLFIAILSGWVFVSSVRAAADHESLNELALPAIFSENAVFQRDKEVRIWGWSQPRDIRESQKAAALNDDRVHFVTTIDTGEENEIHPCFKKPIGERAAYEALGKLYKKGTVGNGPVYAGMRVKNDTCIVTFTNVGGGLVSKSGKQLSGFSISADGINFQTASAEIVGDTVVVSCPNVPRPVAVRYAWEGFPEVSLFSKEGLPASPFCTK